MYTKYNKSKPVKKCWFSISQSRQIEFSFSFSKWPDFLLVEIVTYLPKIAGLKALQYWQKICSELCS